MLGTVKLVGGRNRMRVNLGHVASASYSHPRHDRYTLELTDLTTRGVQQSKWLPLAIKQCLVHPQRFHQVWGIQTGTQHLFVWEPIPPSQQYVALGMVATTSEDPPPVRSVHCVPREWCEPAPGLTKMLWSDAGSSGKPGSLWAVGSMGFLAAAAGNDPPTQHSWMLNQTRFTLANHIDGIVASGDIRVSNYEPSGEPMGRSLWPLARGLSQM